MKNRVNICSNFINYYYQHLFPKKKFFIKIEIKKIIVKNNFLVKEKDIKKLLLTVYGKNLIFLDNYVIEKALIQNSFIESFNIKKIYPDTLNIKILKKNQ